MCCPIHNVYIKGNTFAEEIKSCAISIVTSVMIPTPFSEANISIVIKQNESEVGSDMLLV